ncbi:MAG: tetratricopeptide repeat protein [Alphaproteobacteria bacterium]|nr:tetratricopeptide repeat protein [Alphaproteobacteria bacterium]
MNAQLKNAIALRNDGHLEQAYEIFEALLKEQPNNPDILYQLAWTLDRMGKESKAVFFYEKALSNNLNTGKEDAMLGLASTYRCIGEYQKSLNLLDEAIEAFPSNNALKIFRTLTLFNLGCTNDAMGELIKLLLNTTHDENILKYQQALCFYSDKLEEVWA